MLAPYQKLQTTLKKQILEGSIQEGQLLPSENKLARNHGITRMTVRKALDALVREGYIEKKQGKGSRVSPRRKTLRLLSFHGFTDAVRHDYESESVQTTIIVSPVAMKWPDPFFYPLSCQERESRCIQLVRLRSVERSPVMLEYTYLPDIGLENFCDLPLKDNSLFQTLNVQYHIDVKSVQQDVRAIPVDTRKADYLKLNPGDPILHIYRRYGTNRPDFYLYSSLYCNTSKYAIGSYYE